jgi:hypothetical protein
MPQIHGIMRSDTLQYGILAITALYFLYLQGLLFDKQSVPVACEPACSEYILILSHDYLLDEAGFRF